MDRTARKQFDRAMLARDRTLAIRIGDYQSRDIKEANFDYGYIKGDTLKPGGTCAGSGKIVFTSIITTFNKLDVLHPEVGLLVSSEYVWVKMGEYFINDIEIDRNRNTTTLDLMDGMFKLNREYVSDLKYPAEITEIIQEICLKTGVELASTDFGLSGMLYRISEKPKLDKKSFRDVLSYASQVIGMSCFFNREGKLEVKGLTDSEIVIDADSYFLHGLTKSEIVYGIAGISCKVDDKQLTVGMRTGRSLELDNVFMTQNFLNNLYHRIKDIHYYPYNLNYQGHLLLDVGQWVTIKTNKNEVFKVPVLSQNFTFQGGLRGRISADSKAGNDTQYSYEGTITKQIKQQDSLEARIQVQLEEADKAFDNRLNTFESKVTGDIKQVKSDADAKAQEIRDEIQERFASFDGSKLDEKIAAFDREIDEKLAHVQIPDLEEIREQMKNVAKTAEINAELIGGDGSIQYSKNRLNAETEQSIRLGVDFIEVGHNGDGFEVGEPYTISWQAVCVPYGHRTVQVALQAPFFLGGGRVSLIPFNTSLPVIDQDVPSAQADVPMVYFGDYNVSFASNWYKPAAKTFAVIDNKDVLQLPLAFKNQVDGNLASPDVTVWKENPDIIFDGGVN